MTTPFRYACVAFIATTLSIALQSLSAEVVFDTTSPNLDRQKIIMAFSAGSGISSSPQLAGIAQPFMIGPHDTVNSVSINAARDESASIDGPIIAQVWDDDGRGVPSSLIGTLGAVDELPVDFSYFFDDPVTGLWPNQQYYIVIDFGESFVVGQEFLTVGNVAGPEHTFGAPPVLVDYGEETNGWVLASEFFPHIEPQFEFPYTVNEFLVMTIEASGNPIIGDFDQDGALTAADIDLLARVITQGSNDFQFDLDSSGAVDEMDHRVWIQDLKQTWFGDANLDGKFDSGDLVEVFTAGEYEDDRKENSTWADGDWNGDLEFDSKDFAHAFAGGGFEIGARVKLATVPEPSTLSLLSLSVLSPMSRRLRQ